MATPNYQFQKRQKELAKKAKQEEKRRQKLKDKAAEGDSTTSEGTPVPPASPDGSTDRQ